MSLYTRLKASLTESICLMKHLEEQEMVDTQVTLEDLKKAKQLLKDYKMCGNSCYGCNKAFKTEETTRTIQHGQIYYWCATCYERIKNG